MILQLIKSSGLKWLYATEEIRKRIFRDIQISAKQARQAKQELPVNSVRRPHEQAETF
jgi:hypothetical protein